MIIEYCKERTQQSANAITNNVNVDKHVKYYFKFVLFIYSNECVFGWASYYLITNKIIFICLQFDTQIQDDCCIFIFWCCICVSWCWFDCRIYLVILVSYFDSKGSVFCCISIPRAMGNRPQTKADSLPPGAFCCFSNHHHITCYIPSLLSLYSSVWIVTIELMSMRRCHHVRKTTYTLLTTRTYHSHTIIT